jgi:hypothetical protein
MLVAMLRASDDATPGSVIAKADRISPSSRGRSQSSPLCRAAEVGQQPDVAGVGGRAVQCDRGDKWAVPGDFGQRRILQVGQPGALGSGQKQVPQAARAGFGFEVFQQRQGRRMISGYLVAGPHTRSLYQNQLVLVRPDLHIAWSGATVSDAAAIIGRARGAA